jgi:hypothetical protein
LYLACKELPDGTANWFCMLPGGMDGCDQSAFLPNLALRVSSTPWRR